MAGTRRSQHGQALVFGTLWLVPLLVLLIAVYAAGQYATAKTELQNTADASAYSVATVAARDYNFSAYMNRAMAANQVAVGQWTGLASWFQYTGQVIENIDVLCQVVPGLDVICDAVTEAYTTFKTAYVDSVWPVVNEVLSYWIQALTDLQLLFHVLTAESLAQNLVMSGQLGTQAGIVKQNDANATLIQWPDSGKDIPTEIYRLAQLITDASEWWHYTNGKQHREADSGKGMARFADVVNASRDDFGRGRGWDLGPVTVFNSDWVWKLLPEFLRKIIDALGFLVEFSGHVTVGVEKRGGTTLQNLDDHYSWAGLDTLEEQNKYYAKVTYICNVTWCCDVRIAGHCVIAHPCGFEHCSKEWSGNLPIPIGWGSAVAQNPQTSGSYEQILEGSDKSYGNAYEDTRTTYDLALTPEANVKAQGYLGLTPYYDVADDRRASPDKAATFTLLVSKKASDVRGLAGPLYDGSATGTRSSVGLPKTECASELFALAQGRVRYSRGEKYSSLFTPSWEGTLSDPDDKAKMIALVMARGLSLDGRKCGARLIP